MFEKIVKFIKEQFPGKKFIPLHEPRFVGKEKEYVVDAIDSTFVSSVGPYVNQFENKMAQITGAKFAIATVNGTSALHTALLVAGVKRNEEVLTQALTFIATVNAIDYCGGSPVFIDIERKSLGMCPDKLDSFLKKNAQTHADGFVYNRKTGKRIAACLPMHTFGFPCALNQLKEVCEQWNIPLVEDAAESLGSYYKEMHTGRVGLFGVFSFNGNKTITCGGGGALITDNEQLAVLAKHLTTQAKLSHQWEFNHDHVGFNYRMPNINAALACAQLEQLDYFIANKRDLAHRYSSFFEGSGIPFQSEQPDTKANYWLNVIFLNDRSQRDEFLRYTNANGVMTRPSWTLIHKLPMFRHCQHDGLENSQWVEDRLVNIPSSVRIH